MQDRGRSNAHAAAAHDLRGGALAPERRAVVRVDAMTGLPTAHWQRLVSLRPRQAALGAVGCASEGAAEAAGGSVAATRPSLASPAPDHLAEPAGALGARRRGANRRLAAQLVFCSVPATNPLAGRRYARMGVGGIVILGGGARSSIGGDLAAVLRAAPNGIKPFIASDEEGGQVQRLRRRHLPAAVGPGPGRVERLEDQGDGRGLRRPAAQAARLGGVRPGRGPGHPGPLHELASTGASRPSRTSSRATSWRG